MLIFLCLDPCGGLWHYFSLFEAVDRLWLTLVFCFALLVGASAAAAGRCRAHWWGSQFLGFRSLHLHLNGFDVQLAFCRTCDRNRDAREPLPARRRRRRRRALIFTFTGLLHERLLFGRNEVFVSLFLLLAQHLCLLHLIKRKPQLLKREISFILQNGLLHLWRRNPTKSSRQTLIASIFFLFFTLSRKKNSPVASSWSTWREDQDWRWEYKHTDPMTSSITATIRGNV